MATGSCLSINLTQKQLEFLKLLDYHEIDIFTIYGIEKMIGRKVKDLNEILENLVHKELLARIEKGKYCRHNFKDHLVISNYLADDGVIAYWSALHSQALKTNSSRIIIELFQKKGSKKPPKIVTLP